MRGAALSLCPLGNHSSSRFLRFGVFFLGAGSSIANPLDEEFAEPLVGPDAELHAAVALHPIADGDNDVEVV